MRVLNSIYFSPNYLVSEIDFDNREVLINAYSDRLEGYYLKPVRILTESGLAFAAGLLILSAIDSVTRHLYPKSISQQLRMTRWIKENLHSINSILDKEEKDDIAKKIITDFRNGLVHESRVKNCGQFSYKYDSFYVYLNQHLVLNPKHMLSEVSTAFNKIINVWRHNDEAYGSFYNKFCEDFKSEIDLFKKEQ